MISARKSLVVVAIVLTCLAAAIPACADELLLFDDFAVGLGNWTIDLGEWYHIDGEFCYNPECVP